MVSSARTAPMSPQAIEFLRVLASVLLRCWILGFVLLLFWFGVLMLVPGVMYGVHRTLFGLGQHEFVTIHYCGMGLVKLVVGLLFLFPWISIQLVLRHVKCRP